MSNDFQLNFPSSSEEEEDDDYWKNNRNKKFNKPIFSDSDSDAEKEFTGHQRIIENVPMNSDHREDMVTMIKRNSIDSSNSQNIKTDTKISYVKKIAENEEMSRKQSIGNSYLFLNSVTSRALSGVNAPNESQTRSNTDIMNTSINSNTSSNSSVTYNNEFSVRAKKIEQSSIVEPRLQAPIPRPKFTLPSTIIENAAFTKPKETVSANTSFPDNRNTLKENLELKTKNSKLEAEIRLLSSKLDEKPDFKKTIDRILLDKTYWLDLYKSKRDKIRLLKEAIESNDGNAILAVALFIKRTLTRDSFHGILINNPVALNQYIFYLEQMNDAKELELFYKYHGNLNEAACVSCFKPVLTDSKQELSDKTQSYHEFEKTYTSVEVHLINKENVLSSVKKFLKLLQIQKTIMKNNSAFLRKDMARQNAMDALYSSSLSYTVSFCLKYNRELNDNDAYGIENLKKEFDLSTKQFSIWFIKSMSEIGSWTELANYTNQRGIFNMVKNPPVSYETIVFIISHVKGPSEQIKKYLSLIENVERRQTLAMKFKQTEVVIETFKIQRDKIGLFNYRNQFRENTPDYIKANITLMDDRIKWRN